MRTMARIVVGVDGSPRAQQALAWALEEARLRRARLQVVHAYEVPADLTSTALAYAAPGAAALEQAVEQQRRHREQVQTSARQQAETVVRRALRDAGWTSHGDVEAEPVLVADDKPSRALLDRARGADLLVVGSRGRGGFTGLLLGSVSQQCVHHAPCPVVVVRPPVS